MTTFSTVDAEAFREAVRPVVDAIGALTEAVDAVAPRFGRRPHVDAPAMRELSDEQDYAGRSGMDAPITLTHSLGGLTLTAATDYVRSFAAPFTTERMPLYGHLVEARAALESATVCWWLNEPGIARDDRVKRGLSEFIYSAVELRQLKLHDKSKQHLKDWLGFAANLGWPVTDWDGKAWIRDSRGKPLVGGVGRPAPAAGIEACWSTTRPARSANCSGRGCRLFRTSRTSASSTRSKPPPPSQTPAQWPLHRGDRHDQPFGLPAGSVHPERPTPRRRRQV